MLLLCAAYQRHIFINISDVWMVYAFPLLFYSWRCNLGIGKGLYSNGTRRTCSTSSMSLESRRSGPLWILPLCLARYLPRTMIRHKVTKTTTATTPPIKAWSVPCCPRALGSEERRRERDKESWWKCQLVRLGSKRREQQTVHNRAKRKEMIISSSFLL